MNSSGCVCVCVCVCVKGRGYVKQCIPDIPNKTRKFLVSSM